MATLEQVQSRIAKLQKQAEELLRKKNVDVIFRIKELLSQHGLTTADIDAHAGATSTGKKRGRKSGVKLAATSTKAAAKRTTQVKTKLPAKYRNPKTGETWSGWARPPAWIKDVKDRTKFLIDASNANQPVGVPLGKKTAKTSASAKSAPMTAVKKRGRPATKKITEKVPAEKAVAKKVVASKKLVGRKASSKAVGTTANASTPATAEVVATQGA
ncbi:hypothetical protein R69608_07030 [Paraburkholderia nemoris]|uniref:H-NS histone family protein n=1 Tax=Paraburkholderia nemoris TaxID=2793076 RepID=UPI0019133EE2|nr:H-NS histone family protein [Paraburkholderia nemoris]MBK5152460.1 H-NS histone family protein [Burkholderia sp. R-69608]CAE6967653.1 hypothetical protein R69608_07030 [Paraburkholderia nemoris]